MRIVHGNAVEQLAARQHAIPDFFETGDAAAAEVVDGGMAVEDLEQARALQLRNSSAEMAQPKLGWLMLGAPPRGANRIDHLLHHVENGGAAGRLDE